MKRILLLTLLGVSGVGLASTYALVRPQLAYTQIPSSVLVQFRKSAYPFPVPVPKGTSIGEALQILGITNAHRIYQILPRRVKEERARETLIVTNSVFEIQL